MRRRTSSSWSPRRSATRPSTSSTRARSTSSSTTASGVHRRRTSAGPRPENRCNAVVAAHELLHMLGALPLGAPHACPGDDGHPCDDQRDLLWPFLLATSLDSTIL